MYDFDMKKLLDAFEGDPSELANAFTSQLNKELAARKSERMVKEAAEKVANAWNEFVEEYFTCGKDVPNDALIDDYVIDANSVIDIMKAFLQFIPMLVKYSDTIEDFNELLHGNTQKAKETSKQVCDTFENTMNKFFNKMGW